jgi:hypothetical protein
MTNSVIAKSIFLMLFIVAGNTSLCEDKNPTKEIIVGFIKNTDEKDISAFEKKFNLTLVKKFKRIYAIRYKVSTSIDCKKTISAVKREKIVRYAELNGKDTK